MNLEKIIKNNACYEKIDGKYVFKQLEFSNVEDSLDKFKSLLKKNDKIYYWLISTISPVWVDKSQKTFITENINKDKICLNVGSGNSSVSKHCVNVDIFAYDNVHVVCDIGDLPFEDDTVDIILNIGVLEHVPNPQQVINEIHRVLKPGGLVFTAFPFMQGFHASPYDFTRVTEEGIKVLHKEFTPLEVKLFGGPTSGLLWTFQEWVAILLSFGSKRLHLLIYLLIMCLTFPIKYLDYFLIKHPMAKNISSGFIFIGQKPSDLT